MAAKECPELECSKKEGHGGLFHGSNGGPSGAGGPKNTWCPTPLCILPKGHSDLCLNNQGSVIDDFSSFGPIMQPKAFVEMSAKMDAHIEHVIQDALAEKEIGCCQACLGNGTTSFEGPCSDCEGTGHGHAASTDCALFALAYKHSVSYVNLAALVAQNVQKFSDWERTPRPSMKKMLGDALAEQLWQLMPTPCSWRLWCVKTDKHPPSKCAPPEQTSNSATILTAALRGEYLTTGLAPKAAQAMAELSVRFGQPVVTQPVYVKTALKAIGITSSTKPTDSATAQLEMDLVRSWIESAIVKGAALEAKKAKEAAKYANFGALYGNYAGEGKSNYHSFGYAMDTVDPGVLSGVNAPAKQKLLDLIAQGQPPLTPEVQAQVKELLDLDPKLKPKFAKGGYVPGWPGASDDSVPVMPIPAEHFIPASVKPSVWGGLPKLVVPPGYTVSTEMASDGTVLSVSLVPVPAVPAHAPVQEKPNLTNAELGLLENQSPGMKTASKPYGVNTPWVVPLTRKQIGGPPRPLKVGLESEWREQNPFLGPREVVAVFVPDGRTFFKIGDGQHYFNDLRYSHSESTGLDDDLDIDDGDIDDGDDDDVDF